ncbi:NADH-quinone oxidoreductase subunit J [Pontibacillus salicampi]|uniref:NADH-quinone oxidoreductase subunit J n=1 Tax=Pontibacillus salicampi TaxID=1449801 RepID=A0ABV6LS62_9BACI
MNGEVAAFLILSGLAIFGAILMLNVTRVIHMLLSLVLTFLSIAGIYVLLSAEFVAMVQVLIYSGAMAILMMFGIMLTKHDDQQAQKLPARRGIWLGVALAGFFVVMYRLIERIAVTPGSEALHVRNTEQIGIALYSHYIIPFELMSIVLLVALIGAIVLARKEEDVT